MREAKERESQSSTRKVTREWTRIALSWGLGGGGISEVEGGPDGVVDVGLE